MKDSDKTRCMKITKVGLSDILDIPYILESNPHSVFGDFLNEKKKLVRGSNPHLSFNCPLPT
jgi:hypothetical protein